MGRPLYVDLDQSLIRTDMLWEQAAQLLCQRPLLFPAFLKKCLGNRAELKEWLGQELKPSIDTLPYNEEVLKVVQSHRASCGPVYLATASHEEIARKIADHLQIFDGILGTSGKQNLKGKAKLAAIREHSQALGFDSFDYVGDSNADFPVWQAAQTAWVVEGQNRSVVRTATRTIPQAKKIPNPGKSYGASLIRLLRPQQWLKNILLFLPLALAHKCNLHLLELAFLAFVSFSFSASAVYILNDFADVTRDRAHPRKRNRPLASGAIPLWQAPLLSAGLWVVALSLGWLTVGRNFIAILGVYLAANLLYTFWLKHRPMVDAVGLALMYTLRLFAGGVATGSELSKWLMAFSMFFFLSLAFGKRYQEIVPETLKPESGKKIRGYFAHDLPVIGISGLSTGYISVMILTLYLYSPEIQKLYVHPMLLWFLCPLVIYWIGRFWLLTWRGALHDDPMVFALTDRNSLSVGLLILVVFLIATPIL